MTTKMWKEKPPGTEQLLLEEMFQNGCIADYATPEAVCQTSELFNAFPARTFAAHFRKTKAKMREFLSTAKGIPGGVIPPSIIPPSIPPTNNAICKIPELGTNLPPSMKRSCPAASEVPPADIINPPYIAWEFADHDLGTAYVCVAINLFAGSREITFDIMEDGLKIVVRFSWATAMYKAAEVFALELEGGKLSKHHPMIHAMSSTMLASGITDNAKPEGQWIIPLPCKVLREVTSYKMSKIESGTTQIMFIRFTAYQNDAIIDQSNRTLTFE